jgi:hypothetical protein
MRAPRARSLGRVADDVVSMLAAKQRADLEHGRLGHDQAPVRSTLACIRFIELDPLITAWSRPNIWSGQLPRAQRSSSTRWCIDSSRKQKSSVVQSVPPNVTPTVYERMMLTASVLAVALHHWLNAARLERWGPSRCRAAPWAERHLEGAMVG